MTHRDAAERIADALEALLRKFTEAGEVSDRLSRIEFLLGRIVKMEVQQMAFAQDVLDRITRQTTVIASIKAWIQALPANTVSEEQKAAILANLDANEAELNTAIPANTPVDPNA